MVGLGPTVFAIWGYCIAKADPDDHTVILNPILIASIIGTTTDDITKAIDVLTKPDPNSKNQDNEGCRLINTTGHEYLVVSHEHYRNMKNNLELREYNRLMKRKEREKKDVNKCQGQILTPVYASGSALGSALNQKGIVKGNVNFDRFWGSYPRKVERKKTLKAWLNAKDKPEIESLLKILENQKAGYQWTKEGGKFIPYPATWLNAGRWDDVIESEPLVEPEYIMKADRVNK